MSSKDFVLTNGKLTRLDLDTEHYYWLDGQYCISVTKVLDIAAPFPEGLRAYLRNGTAEETTANMEVKRDRGSRLHQALDRLMQAESIDSADYITQYEKEAIATFMRFIRFLKPRNFETEIPVADAKRRVAGTLDFVGEVDSRKLEMLLSPTKYLTVDNDGNFQFKGIHVQQGTTLEDMKRIIIDWKFTGRSVYNHRVQVAAYAQQYEMSYGDPVARKFTWRYSPQHKFGFEFQESTLGYESFTRIYDTCLDYLGKFPEPPTIKQYPKTFKLFEKETK